MEYLAIIEPLGMTLCIVLAIVLGGEAAELAQ